MLLDDLASGGRRVHKLTDPREAGNDLPQDLDMLRRQLVVELRAAGNVQSWLREAPRQPASDRIERTHQHDRD